MTVSTRSTMADTFSPSVRSRVMAAVRSSGNRTTELAMASAMRRKRLTGWRRQSQIRVRCVTGREIRVTPDFVFRSSRVAVFVDGCFWHGCPKHHTNPKTNPAFWRAKLHRNKLRDAFVSRMLCKAGWKVIRLWEHETTLNADSCVRRIREAVRSRPVSAARAAERSL